MEKHRVSPTDHTIQCLICDKDVELVFYPNSDLSNFKSAAFDQAVSCSTRGNYGSQILDMDGEAHFVICDQCFITKSHKMLMTDRNGENWQNARDHYDDWIKSLVNKALEKDKELNSYLKTVKPYFNE